MCKSKIMHVKRAGIARRLQVSSSHSIVTWSTRQKLYTPLSNLTIDERDDVLTNLPKRLVQKCQLKSCARSRVSEAEVAWIQIRKINYNVPEIRCPIRKFDAHDDGCCFVVEVTQYWIQLRTVVDNRRYKAPATNWNKWNTGISNPEEKLSKIAK